MPIEKHSLYRSEDFQVASFGGFGVRLFSGASTSVNGEVFHVLEAKTDTTLSATNTALGGDDLSAYVIEAGARVYGLWEDLNITSGDLRAYLIEFDK